MTDWRAQRYEAEHEPTLDAIAYALAIIRSDREGQDVIIENGDRAAIASQLATLACRMACQLDPAGDGEAWLVQLQERVCRDAP